MATAQTSPESLTENEARNVSITASTFGFLITVYAAMRAQLPKDTEELVEASLRMRKQIATIARDRSVSGA